MRATKREKLAAAESKKRLEEAANQVSNPVANTPNFEPSRFSVSTNISIGLGDFRIEMNSRREG